MDRIATRFLADAWPRDMTRNRSFAIRTKEGRQNRSPIAHRSPPA